MLSADQFLKLDFGFPGLSFGYESWALASYLEVLEEQIPHAQKQYRTHAETLLNQNRESLEDAEYWDKLSAIDEIAEREIPHFFRIGAILPIWGLFESFVTDLALYVGKRKGVGISLRDVRANNFRSQVEKYFEGVLQLQLPWSDVEREHLGKLQDLRNFIAHRNGRLMDLPPEKEKEVSSLVSKIPGVSIEGSMVVISTAYVKESSNLVFDLLGRLIQQIADQYGGPVVPMES